MALYSALLAALALAILFYRYLYPAIFSPLSKIPPVHPIASVLPIWLWWKERMGCQARSIFAAHQRLGPVVRVGPNHVHVASLDGLRVVFNSGKFDRSDWILRHFTNYNGTPNMLTLLDSKQHATRRRMVSRIFSKSYIIDSVDFQMLSHILLFDRLVPVFDEAAKTGQGVDMFELAYAAGAEFMSAYQLGTDICLDLVRIGREKERKAYIQAGKAKFEGCKTATKVLEDQGLEIFRKADGLLTSTSPANKVKNGNAENEKTWQVPEKRSGSASTYPVVYARLKALIPENEGPKTQLETLFLVASELLDNLEAARIGIGQALTYILHELTIRPAMQSALREELMTLDPPLSYPSQNRISTSMLRELDNLPLLNAAVMETLRLRIPSLAPVRRRTPEGGALIDGYFIPAGVEVSSSAYSLHMNPAAYPEPNRWNPERWLNIQDAATKQVPHVSDHGEMEKGSVSDNPRRWFWAFSSGSRMCVGNNFSLIVIKLITASIYTNYTTYIIDDEGIEQLDNIVASPAGDKLVLGFSRIPKV